MVYKEKNPLILVALLVAGLVIGSILGDYLGANRDFEVLKRVYPLGFEEPFKLDLGILKLNFALLIKINLASALGIIAAILAYRKI